VGVNLTIGLATGGRTTAHWTGTLWAAVLYLAIFGSLAGYTAYLFLLRNVPISLVSTYAYVNPVVAVLLGSTGQHQPLHGRQWVAMALVIASVAVVLSSPSSGETVTGRTTMRPSP
jgi:drug/metabolite transporter (DMT)-like permease